MDFKSNYFSDWMAAYNLHKKFYGMSGTDKEWEALLEESEQIYRDGSPFMKSLIRAVIDDFERLGKEKG